MGNNNVELDEILEDLWFTAHNETSGWHAEEVESAKSLAYSKAKLELNTLIEQREREANADRDWET